MKITLLPGEVAVLLLVGSLTKVSSQDLQSLVNKELLCVVDRGTSHQGKISLWEGHLFGLTDLGVRVVEELRRRISEPVDVDI